MRGARRRVLEGLALLVVALVATSMLGVALTMQYNVERHVYLQIRDRAGDVILLGSFPVESVEAISSLEGAARVEAYSVLPSARLVYPGGETLASVVPANMLADVKVKVVDGDEQPSDGEAIIYYALSGPPLQWVDEVLGKEVKLGVYVAGEPVTLELLVVGVARGFEWLGGQRVAVVVPDDVIWRLSGERYTLIAVYAPEPGWPGLDVLAEEAAEAVESTGGNAEVVRVNRPESNPIVALVTGALSVLTVPSAALVLLVVALPAAAGVAQAVRDSRWIGVLKAMGATKREVYPLIAVPWLLWGGLGSLLGAALATVTSEPLYSLIIVGDSEVARLLYESYGFIVPLQALAKALAASIAGILVGSFAPLAVSATIDPARTVKAGGLPIQLVPPRIRLPLPLTVIWALRDAAARPWRILGTAMALAVVLGIAGAMTSLSAGLDGVAELYAEEMPPDVYISVRSITLEPPQPVWRVLERAVSSLEGVKGYTVLDSHIYFDAIGMKEMFVVVAVTAGDPSTAFPLVEGRYPQRPGEAVISTALASLLDNGVGDELILNLDGKEVRLSIVGLSISRLQNGFYVLLTVDGYEDLTGSLPGVTKATAHIDVIDMVEPDEYMERLKEKLSMAGYLAVETAVTRDELVDAISILSVFLHGVMGAMFILASAGAATIIASLSAVDAGARQLEHATLLAIGMNSRRIIATYILQTVIALTIAVPPGYVASLLIAEVVAKRSAIAIGYIEYATSPLEVFSAATLLGALTLGAAAGWLALWLHLRRMRVADVIREA